MKTLAAWAIVLIALGFVLGQQTQMVDIDWTGENQCLAGSQYHGPAMPEPQLYLNFDSDQCGGLPGGAEVTTGVVLQGLSTNFGAGVTSQYGNLGTYDPSKFCFIDVSCPNGFTALFWVKGGAGNDGGVITTVYKGDQAEPNVGFSVVASGDKFAVSLMTNTPSGGRGYYAETTPGTRDGGWTHVGITYHPAIVPQQCPDGFQQMGGNCYMVDNREMSFYNAESACNQHPDSHLASFHSEEQFNFLLSLTGFERAWCGARTTDTYYGQGPLINSFTDGSLFDYTPPGGFGDMAGCGTVVLGDGTLSRTDCFGTNLPFICQMPIADNNDVSFSVYINGNLDANDADGPTNDCCNAYSNYKLLFGAEYTNELDSGLGSNAIDDLQIYDRALSADEVRSTFTAYV